MLGPCALFSLETAGDSDKSGQDGWARSCPWGTYMPGLLVVAGTGLNAEKEDRLAS